MISSDDVRRSYDTVAVDYEQLLRAELDGRPIERGILHGFAESVRAGGLVLDAGCGPGRVSAYLQARGLNMFGVDLSAGMIDVARRAHPGIDFEQGSIDRLDIGDGSLAGLLAWYSVIHTPDDELPTVFAEFHRVLEPGAPVLLAFQSGDVPLQLTRGYGHDISLVVHRRQPEVLAHLLVRAGFETLATTVKEPDAHESGPRAYLLAART